MNCCNPRYSYPAIRHKQNQVQRGSLFSVATTNQTSGYSWLFILKAMRKQDLSLSAGLSENKSIFSFIKYFWEWWVFVFSGFGFCTCAVIVNSFIFYSYIYDRLDNIYDGKKHYLPIDVIIVALYYVGACIGSIVCGMYPYTWPARRSNVRKMNY